MKPQTRYGKRGRRIAKKLDKHPHLRQTLKFYYQKLFYFIYRKANFTYELHSDICLKSILKNKNNIEAFFG